MRYLLTVAAAVTLGPANAQMRIGELAKAEKSDPATPVLMEWQQGIEDEYEKGGLITPIFSDWFVLSSDSIKTLFPQYHFYAVSWMEKPAPGKEAQALGLSGHETTLVYDPAGKVIGHLSHTGSYEEFGKFLAAERVAIRDADDAKLVWSAFCDLHQRHWRENPAIRIDARTWHLGCTVTDGVRYCYEVLLDDDFRVLKARLRSDEAPAR